MVSRHIWTHLLLHKSLLILILQDDSLLSKISWCFQHWWMVSYHIMSSSSNDYNIEQRLLPLLCLYLGKGKRADCKFCFCEPQVSESAWSSIKQQQANKQKKIETGWFINNRDWFPTPEARSPRWSFWRAQCLGTWFLIHRYHLFTVISHGRRGEGGLMTLSPFRRAPPSKPNHLPKSPPPNPIPSYWD